MKKNKIHLLKIYSILLLLLILVIFILIGILKYLFIYFDTKNRYKEVEEKNIKEMMHSEKLKKKKEKYQIQENIESKILKKYMLQKPGEKVVQFID